MPSTVLLSQKPALMAPLDLLDRAIARTSPEFGGLPPNSLRIRIGVDNRILFNQPQFLEDGYRTWQRFFATGLATERSRVVDIGSGCGRTAIPLIRMDEFAGSYLGIDVDAEMVGWCREHLVRDGFEFVHADMYNALYNPTGSREKFAVPRGDDSQDLVISVSLFTHLLEDDLLHYAGEARRVLAGGGKMAMSVFCIEHMRHRPEFGERWSFRHQRGRASVENPKYPEAAVGYRESDLVDMCLESGFDRAEVQAGGTQSWLVADAPG